VSKVLDAINKCLVLVIPFIEYYKADKILRKKIENPQSILDDVDNPNAISIDILKGQYADAIYAKDKLEDKAKTNLIGITIAITLITGASGILSTVYENYTHPIISGIVFVLLILATIYMIAAGILSFKVLVDENRIHTVSLNSFAAGETALREDYGECISQNRNRNLIRNNCNYTSYICIRNALACLFVVLFLSAIPYAATGNSATDKAYTNDFSEYSFVYSSSAVAYIKDYEVQDSVEIAIKQAVNSGVLNKDKTALIGINDSNNSLFIKFSMDNRVITVWLIEPYTTP
jgi:hypothetical protein